MQKNLSPSVALAATALFLGVVGCWTHHVHAAGTIPINVGVAKPQTATEVRFAFSVTISPDGKTVACGSGGANPTIFLWDVQTGVQLHKLRGHKNNIDRLTFSADGKTLVSSSRDRSVVLWDATTGEKRKSFSEASDWVTSMALTPDGETLITNGDWFRVILWDAKSGKKRKTLGEAPPPLKLNPRPGNPVEPRHDSKVLSVAVSSDGATVASGSAEASDTGRIILWDATTGRVLRLWTEAGCSPEALAFTPDGNGFVAACGKGNRAIRWNLQTGERTDTEYAAPKSSDNKGSINSLAFSLDGETLAGGDTSTGVVVLWNAETSTVIRTLPAQGSGVTGVAFSPDGRTLASSVRSGKVILWDATTGEIRRTLAVE